MNNPSFDDLLKAQLERELLMNELAVDDLRRATGTAEERLYASHTAYGTQLRRKYVDPIASLMEERANEVRRGKASQGATAVAAFIGKLPWETVAHITLSTMLDAAGVPKAYKFTDKQELRTHNGMILANVYRLLGSRLENECRLIQVKKNFRGIYARIKEECFTENAGYEQKIYRFSRKVRDMEDWFRKVASGATHSDRFLGEEGKERAAHLADVLHWDNWSDSVKIQLGGWLAKIVNDYTGWFAEDAAEYTPTRPNSKRRRGNKRTIKVFIFSQAFNLYRMQYMETAESFCHFNLPTLIPPKDHTLDAMGGYWFGAAVGANANLIRGWNPKTTVSQLTLDFLNKQQKVPFRLNRWMYDIVQYIMNERGWSILGKKDEKSPDAFRPYVRGPEPKRSQRFIDAEIIRPGTVTFEGLSYDEQEKNRALYNADKAERMEITRWYDRQAELLKLSIQCKRYFRLLEHIKDDPAFFFPWSLDWRTRCYPLTEGLTNQGPEFQKAVLCWAEDQPVDSRTHFWLANNLGVSAGLSKKPYEERVQWIESSSNRERVIAVATDPLGAGFDVWTNMDEPWIFLSTAREYYEIYIAKTKDTTNIVCLGHDATCSGLQLLGGMSKDFKTCDLVNCTGNHDAPQDAYGAVLNKAIELITTEGLEATDGKVYYNPTFPTDKIRGVRAIVKPPVMTKAYGAGHDTRVLQIKNALTEEGIVLAKTTERHLERVKFLVNVIEEAMRQVIPGADAILEWFQAAARQAYENGVEELVIETASGNRIVCNYRESLTKSVETESLGGTKAEKSKKLKRSINRTELTVIDDSKEGGPDIESGVLGIGANLTHGAGDAALLQLAFHDADFPFVTTHDCVYTPCTEAADKAHTRVRRAFAQLCKFPTLERFAEVNGVVDLPPPIVGDYNPDDVLKARYFFC